MNTLEEMCIHGIDVSRLVSQIHHIMYFQFSVACYFTILYTVHAMTIQLHGQCHINIIIADRQ